MGNAMGFVRSGLALFFTIFISSTASAQLLPPIVQQVVGCTVSLTNLASSPKLDAALQSWARNGGSGRVRVIISPQGGLLATVQSLVGTIGGTVLGNFPGINAIGAEVNATSSPLLLSSPMLKRCARENPLVGIGETLNSASVVVCLK